MGTRALGDSKKHSTMTLPLKSMKNENQNVSPSLMYFVTLTSWNSGTVNCARVSCLRNGARHRGRTPERRVGGEVGSGASCLKADEPRGDLVWLLAALG